MPERKRQCGQSLCCASSRNVRPKLGQHFLVDDAAASASWIAPRRHFAKPRFWKSGRTRRPSLSGFGERARRLIAIELDRVLAAQLRMNFSLTPNVEIIEATSCY